MSSFAYRGTVKFVPELDKDFRPIALDNREYIKTVREAHRTDEVKFAVVRNDGFVSTIETRVLEDKEENRLDNIIFIERSLKTLLWLKGGWKVIFAGPYYRAHVCTVPTGSTRIRVYKARRFLKGYLEISFFAVDIFNI